MTDSESELRFDEMERDNLQVAISAVEAALAASTSGTRGPLENFLRNAKSRIFVLEKKIKDSQVEREHHARDEMALSDLAAKETALSAKEKETYNGFLKEDFFTKRDFAKLSEFYAHSWDRLSEGGKDQMSKRVWEGVRRDQYKFSDLPQVVQEKEEDRAYAVLKKREAQAAAVAQIPAVDREDFVRAYEDGQRVEAGVILDRPSFRENMFLGEGSTPAKHIAVEVSKETETAVIRKSSEPNTADVSSARRPQPSSGAKASLDAAGLKLEGVTLAAPLPDVSAADIPNAGAEKTKDTRLLRGG